MGPECQALQDTLTQSSAPTTPNRSTPPASGRSSSRGSAVASSTLSCPASSLLLSTKPFKCPKPNCNKSYKQANGLKYHMTHGSCNFAPPNDLLERKRRDREKLNGAADRREHLEGVKALAASVETPSFVDILARQRLPVHHMDSLDYLQYPQSPSFGIPMTLSNPSTSPIPFSSLSLQ
ncbi:hypothetical protein JOM56_004777 [Amanita muscaria]